MRNHPNLQQSLVPRFFGGSSIEEAKKNCDGKKDLYILELGLHAKCKLYPSKVVFNDLEGGGYIDFEYEYIFSPTIGNIDNETLDYCISHYSNVEKFKETEIPDDLRQQVSDALIGDPYRYRVAMVSGSNFHKQWTYFSSEVGTKVVYVAVRNHRFDQKKNNETPDDDWYFSEDDEIIYENIVVAVLMKKNKILTIEEVPSVGEVFADADGDGFPEVIYQYEDSENTRRELTDLRPDKINR